MKIATLALALLLAGCGPDGQGDTTAGTTSNSATSSSATSNSPAASGAAATGADQMTASDKAEQAATLTPDSQALPLASEAELYQQIQAMTANRQADNVSQCRVAPLGHKPCGGPQSYLVYSVKSLDEVTLLQKIEQYSQLSQARQEAAGLVSDCAIVPEPAVALKDGVCVASLAGAALAEQ